MNATEEQLLQDGNETHPCGARSIFFVGKRHVDFISHGHSYITAILHCQRNPGIFCLFIAFSLMACHMCVYVYVVCTVCTKEKPAEKTSHLSVQIKDRTKSILPKSHRHQCMM